MAGPTGAVWPWRLAGDTTRLRAKDSYGLISKYFRGAAIVLRFFATPRLFYFDAAPVPDVDSVVGQALLLLVLQFR